MTSKKSFVEASFTKDFEGLNMTTKRSFVEAFLEEEAREENASKRSTRIALARAKNKQDTLYQNLKKKQKSGRKK